MKKECALCNLAANVYCESDEASLCWSCDSKIHSANFLVAKHLRSLLCHMCQSQTPWKASGAKIGSTLSVCGNCATNNCSRRRCEEEEQAEESQGGNDTTSDVESDENIQVVPPWTCCSEEESSTSSKTKTPVVVSLKRRRHNDDEDDVVCEKNQATSCLRPLKEQKREESSVISKLRESGSDVLVNSLRKFHQEILSGMHTCNPVAR